MSSDIEKLKQRIKKLIDQRKFDKAAVLMEDLIENNPDNPTLYLIVAGQYIQNEQFEHTLNIIQKGLDRLPDNRELLAEYGNTLYFLDRFGESEKIFRELIDLIPGDMVEERAAYYNGLAYALEQQDKIDEAVDAWKTVLKLDPDNFEAEEKIEEYETSRSPKPEWMQKYNDLVESVDIHNDIFYDTDFDENNDEHKMLLRGQYEMVMNMLEVITSEHMINELENIIYVDVRNWLLDITKQLVRFDMIQEASSLGEKWANATGKTDYLADRAIVIARAGAKEQPYERISQLCEVLSSRWYLTNEEIDDIIKNTEFFQPYLRKALKKRAALVSVPEDTIDSTDSNGICILTEFNDTSIIPDLIKCLRMSEEDLDAIYGDMLTQNMWLPFARVGHKWFDEIWEFVTDVSAFEFARLAAVSGVIAMHHFHPEYRAQTVSFIERLLEREDVYPADYLASILCECAQSGLTELTDKAKDFADYMETIDSEEFPIADSEDLRKALLDGAREDFIKRQAHNVYMVNEEWRKVTEEQKNSKQNGRSEELNKEDEREVFTSAKEYRPEQKIGRNDPCPCGSGKKYKKCHGM